MRSRSRTVSISWPLVINGRYGFGSQGFGLHALMLSPNELKGTQMMAWLPWERAKAVLDSRHTFPQYLPSNRWFPDDEWSAEYQHHLLLGESAVELDTHGIPVGGTVFEAPFCSILHYPDRHVDASAFSGQQLGNKPFSWGRRPAGCE